MIFQRSLGLHCRSWVIWYYTFGVNCTKKFSRSHTHLFHFVKDPKKFTFNADAIRVPSARQLVYADARANREGPAARRHLDPSARRTCRDGFTPDEDTWYFPRVCGTFKERAGWHGCQMPEQLLGRIIKVSLEPRRNGARSRSPAAARRWSSPRSWAGRVWVSSCRRTTQAAFANGSNRRRRASRWKARRSPS